MGSQKNYETSYRCAAYLMALAPIVVIISIIPYAGGIINMVIYVYYLVIASTQVHNIPSQKAWLVFGIIGGILALIGISAEYKARNMAPTAEQYRKKSDETIKQYEKFLEEAKARKEAERNR
jgi:NADH:ubiquinone oxidoreductase subunit 6 (subunit J)